jgi:hypothetical protein
MKGEIQRRNPPINMAVFIQACTTDGEMCTLHDQTRHSGQYAALLVCNCVSELSSEYRYKYTVAEFIKLTDVKLGARGSVVVKALCYKPEGRGLVSG